jgi:hypothetical protein
MSEKRWRGEDQMPRKEGGGWWGIYTQIWPIRRELFHNHEWIIGCSTSRNVWLMGWYHSVWETMHCLQVLWIGTFLCAEECFHLLIYGSTYFLGSSISLLCKLWWASPNQKCIYRRPTGCSVVPLNLPIFVEATPIEAALAVCLYSILEFLYCLLAVSVCWRIMRL